MENEIKNRRMEELKEHYLDRGIEQIKCEMCDKFICVAIPFDTEATFFLCDDCYKELLVFINN